MKFGVLLATLFLMSCSEITLLRTEEIRSVESHLKIQIDSLRYVVDSLSQLQISMTRKMQADLRLVMSALTEGNEKLQMRLEENQYLLDKITAGDPKTPKVALSPALAAHSEELTAEKPQSDSLPADVADFNPELEKLYSDARTFFNNKQYKEAFLGFKQVYEKDPVGSYAENALYWMASCYDQTGQAENALTVIKRQLLEFPGGGKKCQALFQQGRLLGELKKEDEQQQVWQNLVDDPACAGSNEAFRAGDLLGKKANP